MAPRVMTVVGARPQFVKAAVVSHAIGREGSLEELLVHTGQHYDYGMSQAFFDELSIPEPHVNLGISGGTHAEMTARMLTALEGQMLEAKPKLLLLYGDTNSTLAGALAAAKLHIPVAHVEAGARTRSMTNPEEINRVCCDHVSSLLMACTEVNLANLEREGLGERSMFVGDPMFDAFLENGSRARRPLLASITSGARIEAPEHLYYLTCHREENTSDPATLEGILSAMASLDAPVVYPVHPRNRRTVTEVLSSGSYGNVIACDPVGYLESVWLVRHAVQVVTDSGGLQREAFFAGVKCTTVLPFEVWPETMVSCRNLLAHPTEASILDAMSRPQEIDPGYAPFGDGHAADAIVSALKDYLN